MELVEYVDAAGKSPFGAWFNALPPQPAAKIAAGLAKLEQGNLAGAKGVGAGVWSIASTLGQAIAFISLVAVTF